MTRQIRLTTLVTAGAVLSLLLLACLPNSAHAHAVLLESTPTDGALLATPPGEALLRFNARIEKGVSQITLRSADGREVHLSPASRGPGADKPDRLVITLPPLGPGSYQLRYRVLATDGHATPGLIRFTIRGTTP